MLQRFQKMINAQYRRPTGLLGRWIGRKMAQQHTPENAWTIGVLGAQAGEHVLEIGFGPGLALEHLAKQVPGVKISGIDYSRAMVRAASRRNWQSVQTGQIKLQYGDVHQLPFADATYDRVYSIHSVYFWHDAKQALREIRRVMQPGGTLVLTLLPSEKPETGTEKFTPYTGQQLETLLAEMGFQAPHSVRDPLAGSPSNFAVVATR